MGEEPSLLLSSLPPPLFYELQPARVSARTSAENIRIAVFLDGFAIHEKTPLRRGWSVLSGIVDAAEANSVTISGKC